MSDISISSDSDENAAASAVSNSGPQDPASVRPPQLINWKRYNTESRREFLNALRRIHGAGYRAVSPQYSSNFKRWQLAMAGLRDALLLAGLPCGILQSHLNLLQIVLLHFKLTVPKSWEVNGT